MFIGFLKAVESVVPIARSEADDSITGAILSSLNTRIVQMIFPDGDHDEKHLYNLQDEMHKLQIPDRVTSFMEEIHDRMPKNPDGTPDKTANHDRIMDALFPRKDEEEVNDLR